MVHRFIITLAVFIAVPLLAAEHKAPVRSGEDIYRTYCSNCHGGGWQGAPVAYDEREWTPRMTKGFEELFTNSKQGLNAMPPMGTCDDCSDAELAAAIKEMLRF